MVYGYLELWVLVSFEHLQLRIRVPRIRTEMTMLFFGLCFLQWEELQGEFEQLDYLRRIIEDNHIQEEKNTS